MYLQLKKLIIPACVLLCNLLNAQTNFCASDEVNRKYLLEHPDVAAKINDFNKQLSEDIKSGNTAVQRSLVNGIYEIPVVVHVFHNGEEEGTLNNPSDGQIQDWINFTNDIYASTVNGFSDSAVIPVRLVLAQRDANCNATNGITRVNGSGIAGYQQYGLQRELTEGATQDQLRAYRRWNPEYFYNIYIVNTIDNGSPTDGFAYYAGTSLSIDGAYIAVRSVNTQSITAAHEIGHALGLRHVFDGSDAQGGECPVNDDCTLDNDLVCDTAAIGSMLNTYPAPTSNDINECSGTNYNGEQNNIMNYGYVLNKFTTGQSERAIAQLLRFRGSLINSKGGLALDDSIAPVSPIEACIPFYPGELEDDYGVGPRSVHYGSISNDTGARTVSQNNFYIDYNYYSCISYNISTIIPNTAATLLSVGIGTNAQNIKVYIDFNNNGVFNEGNELVMNVSNQPAYSIAEQYVTPIRSAVLNVPLRMRVISDFFFAINSCNPPLYGQIEDYAVTFTNNLSVNNPIYNADVSIYPNPFEDNFQVKSANDIIHNIKAYDLNGRLVFNNDFNTSEVQVNMNSLAAGIYMVKATTDNGTFTKKVIKK
ncbi:hypothetical protein Q765_13330 [Flavobacterium rivuli WB 3.3-2 = DSM 21788]|uniref:Secretion system C-terminal sorting domain-containing protein n=1 Tax=Flavobacterium rivuli WB 3.3-2 = DSM 21788 TaxID=1121895 RepID=A0A0A2M3I9_9FLAO|nr:zinc-dependent metalloprotease [Flavobacterium rivuli]KGO86038.1 hypothetical protein Q765_13330 [Flavobacterium rivuli WB 3.3-2 = DSM 21788]